MKVKNKLFLIALILSLIFSISAIAAQENVTFDQSNEIEVSTETDSNSNVLKLEEQQDTQTISNENTDSSTLTASNMNYTDIQWIIDAATYGSTIYLNGGTYEGSTELIIDKDLTIYGGSHSNPNLPATLISYGVRAMNITGNNVIISGVTFINGSSDDGGAILITGNNCTIENCIFENNIAYYGGAISNYGDDTKVTDCRFTENQAEYY